MSEYKKISRWISEIEQNLYDMRSKRAETEARIAKRINRIVLDAISNEFWLPQDKVALCNRLNRMARLLEAEDNDMSTLKQVEKEVENIYGDQSNNSTYYFSGKSAAAGDDANWYEKSAGDKEKQEMEDLSTYDADNPENKDVRPEKDHSVVQKQIEKDKKKQKESSWSDFAQSELDMEHMGFEDDGEYIDDGDGLTVDVPDEYDFDPKDPLDDFDM